MANNGNPYGLPPLPPMANITSNSHQYHHQFMQQQSERISGDGEEVHRLGYLRPGPIGPPPASQLLPPILGAAQPSQGNTGIGYNYENFNQIPLSGNPYDQYDYGSVQQVQSVQQNGIVEDEGYPMVDNRSIDGEEQHLQRYGNDPTVPIQGMGMVPPVPMIPLSIGGGILTQSQQTAPLIMNNPSMSTMPMESHQPVGVETPQQYLVLQQQEQRSETIGSAAVDSLPSLMTQLAVSSEEDYREIGGDFVSLGQQSDNDPRSIEGQEYHDPELMDPSTGASTSLFASSSNNHNHTSTSMSGGIPLVQEYHRSQTIGSETQVEDDSRSIEGQEHIPNDFTIGSVGTTVGHAGPPQPSLQSSNQRSETLGSDTIHDEPRGGHKNSVSKSLNPPSGSETGDSVGRNARDRDGDDRRRQKDESENKSSRGKRSDGLERRRHRHPSSEDDDSLDDEDRSRYEKRREREWEKDRKVRPRDKDRTRNDSRRERELWDSVSTRDSFRPYKNYGADGEDYRPRSRNSSYHDRDDYHPERSNRRGKYDSYGTRDDYEDRHWRERGHPTGYANPPRSRYVGPPASTSRFGGGIVYPGPYGLAAVTDPRLNPQMYLQKLCLENPPVYREWYRQYQAHLENRTLPFPPIPGYQPPVGIKTSQMPKRPPATHSGQSSVAELSIQDEPGFRPIQDEPREPSPPKRMTPLKFHTSHSLGLLTPLGQLLRVRNGGTVVELLKIKPLMRKLPEYKEVKGFPGPLIKDVTHKNTIVQFCQRKIRELEFNDAHIDRDNLILMWELLILLLKQNGMAIGSDVAELLLKSKSAGREFDKISDREFSEDESNRNNSEIVNQLDPKDEEKCVEKFCELLLYGHKKEALDYAMDNGLWGHALFFASKMGDRMYGTVLARFANGMAMNSPLQTLYQILSGKQPASSTCCCDDFFGDWKPHLAMILSNSGLRPDVESKAIITLGDTLGSRNHIFAAQFCYLVAEVEFSPDSKLGTHIGFIPSMNNLLEATQMTEIYEFARTLGNPNFTLGTSFIESKLNYTKTLIANGFIQEGFLYCEELTKSLRKGRIQDRERSVGWNILQIAERLVNCDDSTNSVEPVWIKDLRKIADQEYEHGSENTSRKASLATSASDIATEALTTINQLNQYPPDIHYPSLPAIGLNSNTENQLPVGTPYIETPVVSNVDGYGYITQNQTQWNPQPMSLPYETAPASNIPLTNQNISDGNTTQLMSNGPSSLPHGNGLTTPNTHSNNNYLYSTYGSNTSYGVSNSVPGMGSTGPVNDYPKTEDRYSEQNGPSKPIGETKRPKEKSNKSKSLGDQKEPKSWLGGIFGKLIPKQAHLPEDKDPSIIWDPVKKVWVNTNEDEDDDSGPKGPPPKDSDLMGMGGRGGPPANLSVPPMQNVPLGNPMTQTAPQFTNPMTNGLPANHVSNNLPQSTGINGNGVSSNSAIPPPGPNAVNKYKRPKGISLRNNYVDVFNPNAPRKSEESMVPSSAAPATGPGSGMPNIFIPNPAAAISDSGPTNFLSSSAEPYPNSNEGSEQVPQTPQMFNPSQFQNQNYGVAR